MSGRPVVAVRHWAAARELAGTATESVPASTVGGALAVLTARHGAAWGALADKSLLLVDGTAVPPGDRLGLALAEQLEVLPPYAGG